MFTQGSSWNRVIKHCWVFFFLNTSDLVLLIEHLYISSVAFCVNLIIHSFYPDTQGGSFMRANEKVGEELDRLKPGLVTNVSENIEATSQWPCSFSFPLHKMICTELWQIISMFQIKRCCVSSCRERARSCRALSTGWFSTSWRTFKHRLTIFAV